MPTPTGLTRLLSLAGPALGSGGSPSRAGLPAELAVLSHRRDGWMAYFSALHVFPLRPRGAGPGLAEVNAVLSEEFGALAAGHTAFAQDLFGVLFTWSADGVSGFDPETGEAEWFAADLDGWADAVIAAPEELVGSAFAYDWQERHGALKLGERLVALVPWALDGSWDDVNLEPRDTLLSLRERAALARVLAELPDGAEVEWPLPGTRLEP